MYLRATWAQLFQRQYTFFYQRQYTGIVTCVDLDTQPHVHAQHRRYFHLQGALHHRCLQLQLLYSRHTTGTLKAWPAMAAQPCRCDLDVGQHNSSSRPRKTIATCKMPHKKTYMHTTPKCRLTHHYLHADRGSHRNRAVFMTFLLLLPPPANRLDLTPFHSQKMNAYPTCMLDLSRPYGIPLYRCIPLY